MDIYFGRVLSSLFKILYFGKITKLLEDQIKELFNSKRLIHLENSFNGIVKDLAPDREKRNIIYKYKCHCNIISLSVLLTLLLV